jgi:hypothetical protein
MAITRIKEKWESGTGEIDVKRNARYQRLIQVECQDHSTRQGAVILAVMAEYSLTIGTHYLVTDPDDDLIIWDEDEGSFLESIAAAPGGPDGCQWDVTLRYGPAGGEADTFPANPLDWPVQVEWTTEKTTKALLEDRDGNPIVNAAGEYFEEPVERPAAREVLKLVRNQATFSTSFQRTWMHTINDADFAMLGETFPAKTILIDNIVGKPVRDPDVGWYWIVTFDIIINMETWTRKIANTGMRTRDATSNKLRNIHDEFGQPISTPVMLKEDGTAVKPDADAEVFLDFEIYPEMDFTVLGLSFTGVPGY